MGLRFDQFSAVTFDCYGTLIDWERGVLDALRPVMTAHDVAASDDELLDLFERYDLEVKGGGYIKYGEVLRRIVREMGRQLGFAPSEADTAVLAESIGTWSPFPDTIESLEFLKSRYRLVIISNIDDDLFAQTARVLEVPFDEVVTAEQVGAYKPSTKNFEAALARLGLERSQVLHVAQSLAYDIAPARQLGVHCVWVRRHSGRFGMAPDRASGADLEVEDLADLTAAIDAGA